MRLTPQQIDELLSILDRYTWTFLAYHVGEEILTDNQKRILITSGVNLGDIKRTNYNTEHAFKFGILSDSIGEAAAKKMNYDQLKSYLSSPKAFKLSSIENAAMQSLKYQTASEVIKLGERIKGDIKHELVQADLKRHTVKHNSIVTDAARKAIEDRKYVTEVVSQIGRKTGKWNQDLGRISDFVLHQAFDEGRAAVMAREGGDDALVYKDVYPGACNHCIKAYLIGGASSAPRVFKISELKANGTNVGRKAEDWLPVIGPLHPWCRCTLNKAPAGMTLRDLQAGKWEWVGGMFKRVQSDEPRRTRPKVKVQIGNDIIEV
jgi:hypothetical protein